jgi:3alpha(or 20beta)-hydroxysteroid dehydrogenase
VPSIRWCPSSRERWVGFRDQRTLLVERLRAAFPRLDGHLFCDKQARKMNRLNGKIALITGTSQGMGAAHARMFVAEGAKVIMTDLNEKGGKALAAELGPDALFIAHDVTKSADWNAVVREGEAKFGTINVLVNNAGILGPIASTVELTEAQFLQVCAVNQTSVFLGMQAVIPSMLKAGGGSIVNVSSVAGIVAIIGAPSLAYTGSKFAVRGMTKQVAVEYGAKKIRVNSIHPGYIKTPMMAAATDAEGGGAVSQIPLGRLAEPSEVSYLAVFLASDESSYITGMEHVVDGGITAA